jgi:hypothetical protein
MASTVLPAQIEAAGSMHQSASQTDEERHSRARTLHVRQVKPRQVAARNQRLVDPLDRGLMIPLVWTDTKIIKKASNTP